MAKRGVQFIKQDEPAFLKRMKQQAGYKEGPTIDTKREELRLDSESSDGEEREDEQPQVVVLSSSDLTAHQAKFEAEKAKVTPREATNERIVFKKPSKETNTTTTTTTAQHTEGELTQKDSIKKSLSEFSNNTAKDESGASKKKFTARKIKNKSLLSFTENDDE